eukprot:TRINITY_DN5867_c0_g1_i2.p1 TRINITY_DN5867_c0_g1~~TRINITY_DN5867_c0_g1_i2.p1  ORF type:complete len:340 (+),score=105.97 TRINITY_DN5867_c0_g1_i2:326-1345(+)
MMSKTQPMILPLVQLIAPQRLILPLIRFLNHSSSFFKEFFVIFSTFLTNSQTLSFELDVKSRVGNVYLCSELSKRETGGSIENQNQFPTSKGTSWFGFLAWKSFLVSFSLLLLLLISQSGHLNDRFEAVSNLIHSKYFEFGNFSSNQTPKIYNTNGSFNSQFISDLKKQLNPLLNQEELNSIVNQFQLHNPKKSPLSFLFLTSENGSKKAENVAREVWKLINSGSFKPLESQNYVKQIVKKLSKNPKRAFVIKDIQNSEVDFLTTALNDNSPHLVHSEETQNTNQAVFFIINKVEEKYWEKLMESKASKTIEKVSKSVLKEIGWAHRVIQRIQHVSFFE